MKVKAPFEFHVFEDGNGAHLLACDLRRLGTLGFLMKFAGGGFTACTFAVEAVARRGCHGFKVLTVFNAKVRK